MNFLRQLKITVAILLIAIFTCAPFHVHESAHDSAHSESSCLNCALHATLKTGAALPNIEIPKVDFVEISTADFFATAEILFTEKLNSLHSARAPPYIIFI